MASDWESLLSREEVLGGLVARRASTLLFAIESRTAHLVARSRRALARYLTEQSAEEQERAFLDAMAQGREPPLRPTVQDLERYASDWASLVPEEVGVRAALARMIGEKYLLPRGRVPGIVHAIGLDDPAVGERFRALYGVEMDAIYTSRLPLRERWRWMRATVSARLENLPAFWTAFAVTLTETVGAGILALPVAFAHVGPIAGAVVIVVLGFVNILTIAALSEAVARNGNVRYGRAYFGRMVGDYLGPAGARVLTPSLLLLTVVILMSYFIGFASTIADATGIRPELWTIVLLLVLFFYLRRETIGATVASALVVGAATLTLVVMLSLVALTQVDVDHLRHADIPFVGGQDFDRSILELIFGVVLMAFFGHTTTANCAALVLQKEPSGRSLIRGAVWAFAAALGLYVLWVVAVNGAVAPERLASESGTALAPLAEQVGPVVHVLGVVFVMLAMGMAAVHISLGLAYQIRDLLPSLRVSGSHAGTDRSASSRIRTLLRPDVRRVAGFLPTIGVFLVVQGLFLTDRESFAGLLGFLGTVTAPIVAGVFSMLMLYASRRKGDCAVEGGWRFLGHPWLVGGVSAFFITSIVVHGVVLWDDPIRRAVAVLMSVMIVIVVTRVWRTAFTPRAVIELRLGPSGHDMPVVNVVEAGTSVSPDVRWTAHENGKHAGGEPTVRALIRLQPDRARELRVWVHRLSEEGVSEGVPADVEIDGTGEVSRMTMDGDSGHILLPLNGHPSRVAITHPGEVPVAREERP